MHNCDEWLTDSLYLIDQREKKDQSIKLPSGEKDY